MTRGKDLRNRGTCAHCGQRIADKRYGTLPRCTTSECWAKDPYEIVSQWAEGLTSRERFILAFRLGAEHEDALQLKELSEHLGCSISAAYETSRRIMGRFGRFLESPSAVPVYLLINTAKSALRSAVPPELFDHLLPDAHPDHARSRRLLLRVVLPRRDAETGWLTREPERLEQAVATIISSADEWGVIPESEKSEILDEWGLMRPLHTAFLKSNPRIKVMADGRIVRCETYADEMICAMMEIGKPSTAEDILTHMGFSILISSLKTMLSRAGGAHRVTRTKWALGCWGYPRYPGIAGAMKEELEQSGSLPTGELVKRVTGRYDISKQSACVYLGAPMFVVEKHGVRLRREDEPFSYKGISIKDDKGVYDLGERRVGWLLKVDRDVLRGSGIAAPRTVGQILRLRLGEPRAFAGPAGEVTLSVNPAHPSAIPTTGTLRVIARKLGAEVGHLLTFVFDSAAGTVEVTRTRGDEGSSGWDMVERLTGVPGYLCLAGLSAALHSTSENTFRVLRERGDTEVLGVVRQQVAAEREAQKVVQAEATTTIA